MASPHSDPKINEILNFWFNELTPKDWYSDANDELDKRIRSSYESLVEKATTTTELDHWQESPAGSLSLILLCDQMTRNVYRDHEKHKAWSGDAKALDIATRAIAKGYDKKCLEIEGSQYAWRSFFYLPLMHAENLLAQIACMSYMEALNKDAKTESEKKLGEAGMQAARQHLATIMTCGRYPKRNEPLGRESTPVEVQWLKDHPKGF